ncbi:conserved hypothetical protein [Aspergillus terreus NIH2624]|uniref:RecF/RecN/SMC N-terminal domain-containing protein n=1 Tax=Aspergillus terreus (strain NIH 2624 / FGSC A1156) TaxID=341663 RepID=Q0CBE3_ASPTN|nr:uncharacterized protein ATEG_08991 [Aspergillus terreus NIH2624]EAU31123.1 conserved hypothetical protein [Aspergillus terreus NIH2624]
MAPLKRSQAHLEPEDSDEENERLDLTPSSKRPRRSDSPSSSDDSESTDGTDRSQNTPQFTQTVDDRYDEDEDELELRATQAIQEKYSFASDEPNVPAEHGILERVECYNFMCHDHFHVELGPLINFIVGKNGSGKSAVLTAITLCLGGKASATNRGQSLKNFIKEGKESATIVVRIKNQGEGAFMPDDYGKSIIVERHFSKNGTSGFKIKAENGRIMSTKKAELDAIIDHFTLQFDNPMNVLSQDMARQFLSSSSPAEKYKFFVKGVQLEQLDQDYRLIEESADQIEEKLRSREQDVKILKRLSDAAQEKLERSEQHQSLRDRVRNVRNQMAWAQVEEQERERDALDEELAKADDGIANAEAGVERFDDALREAEAEVQSAAEYAWQASSRVEQAQEEKEKIKGEWDEHMNERHDLQAQQRQIKDHLKGAEARIQETQEKIAEENQRLVDLNGGSYARKQEELEQIKADLADAKEQFNEHQKEQNRLYKDVEEAEEALKATHSPIAKTRADFQQAESVLRDLRREGGPRNLGFHERMPALLRAIQQERSFTKQPVGPIGHHVTLLKQEWSSILENSLGATLSSFVVTSKRDMNILSNIMQKVNW